VEQVHRQPVKDRIYAVCAVWVTIDSTPPPVYRVLQANTPIHWDHRLAALVASDIIAPCHQDQPIANSVGLVFSPTPLDFRVAILVQAEPLIMEDHQRALRNM